MSLGITRVGGEIRLIATPGQALVASVGEKAWETGFFGRRTGALSVAEEALGALEAADGGPGIDALLEAADADGYALLELQLDIRAFSLAPLFEERQFHLVDSKVAFLTRLRKTDLVPQAPEAGEVGFASKADREDILRLTRQSFGRGGRFLSRFNNPRYYSAEETARYYTAWIENHLDRPDASVAVIRDQGRCVGYYIYRRSGERDGAPVYKGILSAVDPGFRGSHAHLAMQSFLYAELPGEEFYVDNTTQLTNLATIKNHLRSRKSLDRIDLVFYRRRPGGAA